MPDEDGLCNKMHEIGQDFGRFARPGNQLLRNTCELNNKRWQTHTGIHEALKRANNFARAHANTCNFNPTVRSWAQSSCFSIQHNKLYFIQWSMRATPCHKPPLLLIDLFK